MTTIGAILTEAPADATALSAPDRPDLTYGALVDFVEATGGAIRAAGVARTDRVAIVLPNGPAMASAFLAAGCAAVAAPLNPAYKQDEFAFYMDDLSAKLLITDDAEGFAAKAAEGLGIPVALATETAEDPAGIFTLNLPAAAPLPLSEAQPSDGALVLHTSGTTSRPKIVPLTHGNVTASAANIAKSLALTGDDVCMNIMPLFHIHGLIAAVLASLRAGASIYCTTGFNALKVYAWLEDAHPTWYTAVPTMHQTILARAARNEAIVKNARLRFIRSSSSSLPPQVMTELAAVFGCPVVEAYGMTEAAHQMTSNPLAPGKQKPGLVGLPAGPDVRIWADDVFSAEPGVLGEVVIRGGNVTLGYEANPKANAENFLPGPDGNGIWFRTGDQGTFDEDGFLTITGRLKEIINRGGEKISPREVDEALMDHPAVAQAVAFAVPHDALGEDVAAAVVLREGATADPKDIRKFVAEKIAAFKVPRQILILDEIPKGATGKLQRIGLHEKLGL